MKVCIKVGGKVHCYLIPVFEFPVTFPHPGPGPVNYPQLVQDAFVLSSLQAAAATKVADPGVRSALQNGISDAIRALQKRAGEHVSIEEE